MCSIYVSAVSEGAPEPWPSWSNPACWSDLLVSHHGSSVGSSFDADGVYTFLHGFGYEHAAPGRSSTIWESTGLVCQTGLYLILFPASNYSYLNSPFPDCMLSIWYLQCFSAVEGVDIRVWLLALLLPRCGLGAELTIMAMLVGCIVFLLILIVKLDKDLVEALFHLHQASSQ